jgi:hypothetical protein
LEVDLPRVVSSTTDMFSDPTAEGPASAGLGKERHKIHCGDELTSLRDRRHGGDRHQPGG